MAFSYFRTTPRLLPTYNRRVYPLSWHAPPDEQAESWKQEIVALAKKRCVNDETAPVLPKTMHMLAKDLWRDEAQSFVEGLRHQLETPEAFQAWTSSIGGGMCPPQVSPTFIIRAPRATVFRTASSGGLGDAALLNEEAYKGVLQEALGFASDSEHNLPEEQWVHLSANSRFNECFPEWNHQRCLPEQFQAEIMQECGAEDTHPDEEDTFFRDLRTQKFDAHLPLPVVAGCASMLGSSQVGWESAAVPSPKPGPTASPECLRDKLFGPLKHMFIAYCNLGRTEVLPPAFFYGGILGSQSSLASCNDEVSIITFFGLFPQFRMRIQHLFIHCYGYSNDWLVCNNRFQMRPHELLCFCCDGRSPRIEQAVEAIASLRILDSEDEDEDPIAEAAPTTSERWNLATLKFFAQNKEFHILFKIFQDCLKTDQRQDLLFGNAEKWGVIWNLPEAFRNFMPEDDVQKPWFQTDEDLIAWLQA